MFFETVFLKKRNSLRKMILKMFTTFIVVECQHPPSWLHSHMRLLPGVIGPVFVEFSDLSDSASEFSKQILKLTAANLLFMIQYSVRVQEQFFKQCFHFPSIV